MINLDLVEYNPSDLACPICRGTIDGSDRKYVVHRVQGNNAAHFDCFKAWAVSELGNNRLPRCPHCDSTVATLDGRDIRQVFAEDVPAAAAAAAAEEAPARPLPEALYAQRWLCQLRVNRALLRLIQMNAPLERIRREFPRLSLRERNQLLLTALFWNRFEVVFALANGNVSHRAREIAAIEILFREELEPLPNREELLNALANRDEEFIDRMRQLVDELHPRDPGGLDQARRLWQNRLMDHLSSEIEELRVAMADDPQMADEWEDELRDVAIRRVAPHLANPDLDLLDTQLLNTLADPVMRLVRAGATPPEIEEHLRLHPIGRRAREQALRKAEELGNHEAAAVLQEPQAVPAIAIALVSMWALLIIGAVFRLQSQQ